jgi:hypothetical protein
MTAWYGLRIDKFHVIGCDNHRIDDSLSKFWPYITAPVGT